MVSILTSFLPFLILSFIPTNEEITEWQAERKVESSASLIANSGETTKATLA